MIDCYQILGVSRHASPEEIRAAYLAAMKVCHPDAGRSGAADAAEISQAYWHLRDPQRRADHDRLLDQANFRPRLRQPVRASRKVSLVKAPAVARRPRKAAAVPLGTQSRRRQSKSLDRLRAGAGVAAFSLAIVGFAFAGSHFGSGTTPTASAAMARPTESTQARASVRRRLDSGLARSAADEFRTIVGTSGLAGAHHYARQCLMELRARPTMTMLDYCLAFDDEGSAWEQASLVRPESARLYFAADQRFGRYASAARELAPGPVRESMMIDVTYFARSRD